MLTMLILTFRQYRIAFYQKVNTDSLKDAIFHKEHKKTATTD